MQRFEGQSLRKFLHPFEAAFGSADTNAKTIFHTGRGLRHPKTSTGAVFKSKQSPGKVMDEPAGYNRSNLSRNFLHFQVR